MLSHFVCLDQGVNHWRQPWSKSTNLNHNQTIIDGIKEAVVWSALSKIIIEGMKEKFNIHRLNARASTTII